MDKVNIPIPSPTIYRELLDGLVECQNRTRDAREALQAAEGWESRQIDHIRALHRFTAQTEALQALVKEAGTMPLVVRVGVQLGGQRDYGYADGNAIHWLDMWDQHIVRKTVNASMVQAWYWLDSGGNNWQRVEIDFVTPEAKGQAMAQSG